MSYINWKELLTAGGVIASLVFVGLEISQNTSATRGQTRTELAALNQEWLFLISNPEINTNFGRMWILNDEENMDAMEINQANLLMVSNIRRLENVYYQYEEGLVDESALDSYGFQTNTLLFEGEAFSHWWFNLGNKEIFHPDFVQLFESKIGLSASET